jgi:hypothetical protein
MFKDFSAAFMLRDQIFLHAMYSLHRLVIRGRQIDRELEWQGYRIVVAG